MNELFQEKMGMRRPLISLMSILAGVIFVMVAMAGPLHGSVKATKALCIECHSKAAAMNDMPFVHKPAKEGKCTACHNPHASKHKGLLSGSGSSLCFNCHPKSNFSARVVHKPVQEGNCLSCHEAHSSVNASLLKDRGGNSCFACHPQNNFTSKKNVHPEVRKGNCTTCHSAHASSNDRLLVRDIRTLCSSCHYSGKTEARPCAYDVAGSDCTGCHSPHASDRNAILKTALHKPFEEKKCSACHAGKRYETKVGTEVCIECHKSTMQSFNKINSHLVPGADANSCTSCHNPHASDEKNLFRDKGTRVCLKCHVDTGVLIAKSNFVHPGIGQCSDCHVSHGSNNKFFLSAGAETCSTENCHPAQGSFTHPLGDSIIDPRSKSPMDCSTCHNPMGSPEKFILRMDKDKELCVQCHRV